MQAVQRMWGRTEQGLSAEEKRFAGRWRLINLVTKRFFIPLTNAQNQQLHLSLCGGDAGLLGQHMGQIQALQSLLVSVLSPWVASVSDRYGRMRLMAVSRCSWLVWFALVSRVRTMRERLLLEVATACIYRTEVVVFNAAHVDVFGSRPELSARILTNDEFWSALAGVVVPGSGAFICTVLGNRAFALSFSFVLLSQLLILRTPETLRKRHSPFAAAVILGLKAPRLREKRRLHRTGEAEARQPPARQPLLQPAPALHQRRGSAAAQPDGYLLLCLPRRAERLHDALPLRRARMDAVPELLLQLGQKRRRQRDARRARAALPGALWQQAHLRARRAVQRRGVPRLVAVLALRPRRRRRVAPLDVNRTHISRVRFALLRCSQKCSSCGQAFLRDRDGAVLLAAGGMPAVSAGGGDQAGAGLLPRRWPRRGRRGL